MTTARDQLLEFAELSRRASTDLSAAISRRLERFAEAGRDGISQHQSLAVVVEATTELQRIHVLETQARSIATWADHPAALATLCGRYSTERLRGLIDALAGARPLEKPSGAREAAWQEGCLLGIRFTPPR